MMPYAAATCRACSIRYRFLPPFDYAAGLLRYAVSFLFELLMRAYDAEHMR